MKQFKFPTQFPLTPQNAVISTFYDLLSLIGKNIEGLSQKTNWTNSIHTTDQYTLAKSVNYTANSIVKYSYGYIYVSSVMGLATREIVLFCE